MAFKDEYEKVGAIWERTTRSGKEMLYIQLDEDVELKSGDDLICFRTDKEKPSYPDWRIYRKVAFKAEPADDGAPF